MEVGHISQGQSSSQINYTWLIVNISNIKEWGTNVAKFTCHYDFVYFICSLLGKDEGKYQIGLLWGSHSSYNLRWLYLSSQSTQCVVWIFIGLHCLRVYFDYSCWKWEQMLYGAEYSKLHDKLTFSMSHLKGGYVFLGIFYF